MTVQAPPPTRHEMLCDTAAIIRSVNERAEESNRKWGHNRLPHLVPIEHLQKFRSLKHKWEAACFDLCGSPDPSDIETIRKYGEAMIRAFDTHDRLAVEAGYLPTPPSWWEFELKDGTPVLLVRSRSELSQVDPKGRACQIWSLEEVADIIARFPALAATKDAFPGAEVIQCKTNPVVIDELNDCLEDLPF